MAVLFRPWAQPDDDLQQDATVTTTTVPVVEIKKEAVRDSCDNETREVKYRNVKEHIKKRSEKRNQRSLCKSDAEKNDDICKSQCQSNLLSPFDPFHPSMIPSYPPPIPVPVYPFNVEQNFKDSWDDLNLGSQELLEVALSQGLPPPLVEEYARLLTEQQRQIAEKNRKQRPKKFRCPHCQVGFSNNGQLKGHIRIHTGERPFKCDAENCGKSFTRNEELTRHRRIHNGLRPFPCPECGKRFGRKDHLKKHIRTHFQQRYQLVPIFQNQYPFLYSL